MNTFLFDMDGLLLDSERVYQSAFCDVTRDLGLGRDGDADFFVSLVGSSWPATKAALEVYFEGRIALDAFRKSWMHALEIRLAQGIPVKPTVAECLAGLRERGARMAVVTSSHTEHAEQNLSRAGLRDCFELIKGGDAVSANKPHPAPYLEAALDLGVPADACFAFEDSDMGITAAMAAGCRAVQIPDLRPPGKPLPDLGQGIAQDLAGALRLLGQL